MGRAKNTRKAKLKRPFNMSRKEWRWWTPDDKRDILRNRKKRYMTLQLFYKENGYYETRYHRKNETNKQNQKTGNLKLAIV